MNNEPVFTVYYFLLKKNYIQVEIKSCFGKCWVELLYISEILEVFKFKL